MAELQFDLTLGDTEEPQELESGFIKSIRAGYQEQELRHGANIDDITTQRMIKSYPDYNDNAEAYQSMASVWDRNKRHYIQMAEGFTEGQAVWLDENNNVVYKDGIVPAILRGFTEEQAMKGFLLAYKNGYTQEGYLEQYGVTTSEEAQRIAKMKAEGDNLPGNIIGLLGSFISEPEMLIEFGSPLKIIGKTIAGGATKAFITEAAYAGVAEVLRQEKINEHMEKAGLEYSLWDATKEVLINSGAAGTLRAIGSAVLDWRVVSKINQGITDATDKEIFERYARRENFKLARDTNKHLDILNRAEMDVEDGKNVDVSAHTDIDLATKTDEAVEPVNFVDELSEDYQVRGYDVDENTLNTNIDAPPIVDDVYEGMAKKEDGDALIQEFATHPEIEAELREISELETRLKGVEEHPRFEEAIEGARERSFKDVQSPTRIVAKGTLVRDLDRFGGEDLSTQYKAKGKTLTKKLNKDGFDSIITTDKKGELGEIIILDTSLIKSEGK